MKNTASMTLRPVREVPRLTIGATLSLLLPGIPLSTGLWGILGSIGDFSPLLPIIISIASLTAALFLFRSKKASLWTALTLAALASLCLLFHSPLRQSLSAFLNGPAAWLTRMTGVYHLPFASDSTEVPILVFLAVLSGFLTAALVRRRHPLWLLVLLPLLLPEAMGILHGGWPLAVYLLGAALLTVKFASGAGRPLVAAALALMLTSSIALAAAPVAERTEAGESLAHTLHRLHYEPTPNPLPEGDLRNLPPYTPSREAALEVTMDHWTPLYLRGFVGSVYTGESWQSVAPADAAQAAQRLYPLQKSSFYPATQLSAGWQAVEEEPTNAITVRTLGACRAQAYTPYGMAAPDGFTPNPRQLTGEGMADPHSDTYTAPIYPVTDSYLLQGKLSHAKAPAYRQAEALYREWVYDTCLAVPEDAYNALQSFIQLPDTDMTTTRAREEVKRIVDRLLTYEEATLTAAGEQDFLSYVLTANPKGYSVHYATLSALLLRCCGIPARYVEGYVVTPDMVEVLQDGDSLTLQQLHSHAWCEFYLDGVGWLPFDAVPGHADFLTYPLPPDGVPTEDDSAQGTLQLNQSPQAPQEKPLHIDQEKDKDGHSHWVYLREALGIVILLLAFLLIAFLIRTILLRRKALRRRRSFEDPDPRLAAGRMLVYSAELLTLLGLSKENLPLPQKRPQIAQLLHTDEDLDAVLALSQELWFSAHPVTDAQRALARRWLSRVEAVWRQDIPCMKRLTQRWLTGRVI